MKITFISDTHTRHRELLLPEGDLLVHAGDIMNSGYSKHEVRDFCEWFSQQAYEHKVFIAGNHDRIFEIDSVEATLLVREHKNIAYLEDSLVDLEGVKIYGSPWQPEFYNWAFNIPRGSKEMEEKWELIPQETDILITHGPPQGHLDISGAPWNQGDLGCSLLRERIEEVKPKIHVFGHIHGSYGYKFHNGTHFINASVLNERYELVNDPVTLNWNQETNEITIYH